MHTCTSSRSQGLWKGSSIRHITTIPNDSDKFTAKLGANLCHCCLCRTNLSIAACTLRFFLVPVAWLSCYDIRNTVQQGEIPSIIHNLTEYDLLYCPHIGRCLSVLALIHCHDSSLRRIPADTLA